MSGEILRALAARAGILDGYTDQQGQWRETSDEARIAVLAAMGLDATSDAEAADVLARLDVEERHALVAPSRVVRQDAPQGMTLPLRLAPHERGGARWEARIHAAEWDAPGELELVAEGDTVPDRDGTAVVVVPLPSRPGWYTLEVRVSAGGRERQGTQTLVIAPPRCWAPPPEARWGIVANLYTVRSAENWGIGDFADLRELAVATAREGGDFVGVNPLHATWNRGHDVSPYGPVSRLFRNPLYLRVEDVPELADSPEARAWLSRDDVRRTLAELRAGDTVQYERIARLQAPVLRILHDAFRRAHRGRGTARDRAYGEYRQAMGGALDDFALFLALDERVRREQGRARWFREWPDGLADPRSASVARAREELAEEVDFHRWVQFELDRQLAAAASAATEGGMRIGLYQDLAIGTSGGGSDVWAFGDTFATGVSIGAPPDPLAPQGQDWGLPPLNPLQLRRDGFAYWRLLLRSAFRHAGALRMDHVLGLVRQFWIPWGGARARTCASPPRS